MIVYDLICDSDHRFEGWFGSADDYRRQAAEHLLSCPLCGSGKVTKLPSAAYINKGAAERPSRGRPVAADAREKIEAHQHVVNMQTALLAKLVEYVVKNTEDVGSRFPEEARKIHYNETPERQIRGQATTREVTELRAEGIEVMPIPVPIPSDRGNSH